MISPNNNEVADSVIGENDVKKIVDDSMQELIKDPQKLKAIIEKNNEYQKVIEELKKDVAKRIEELEKLRQRKLELLASL